MGSKNSSKSKLIAKRTEISDQFLIRLNKRPLEGKLLTAYVPLFIPSPKAKGLERKIRNTPDHVKYPPKNIELSEELKEQNKEFNKLIEEISSLVPKLRLKKKRLRVISITGKEGDKFLCLCKLI